MACWQLLSGNLFLSGCGGFRYRGHSRLFSAFGDTGFFSGLLANFCSNFRPAETAHIFAQWHPDGWLLKSRCFGAGPGNLRILCLEITGGSVYDCHPHPHNFYLQILGEVGIVGLVIGVLFLGSISGPAQSRPFVNAATLSSRPCGSCPCLFLADCVHG